MGKESTAIKIVMGGIGYSLSRGSGSGYSLSGSGGGYSLIGASKGYSLAGSGKGYGLTNRVNDSPRGYASAGMKMKGYSIRQSLYGPVSLFPVPYGKIPSPLDEARRLYKKKCPNCGNESIASSYGFN